MESNVFRKIRVAHCMSTYAFAPIVGVSRSTISRLENGTKCMSLVAALKYAKVLKGMTLEEFLKALSRQAGL